MFNILIDDILFFLEKPDLRSFTDDNTLYYCRENYLL